MTSGSSERSHTHLGSGVGRQVYLEDIPLDDARRRFMDALEAVGALAPTPAESIDLADAAGRVTAAPVWARISNPSYHAAAMDGVAVCAAATVGARETRPRHCGLAAMPSGSIPAIRCHRRWMRW